MFTSWQCNFKWHEFRVHEILICFFLFSVFSNKAKGDSNYNKRVVVERRGEGEKKLFAILLVIVISWLLLLLLLWLLLAIADESANESHLTTLKRYRHSRCFMIATEVTIGDNGNNNKPKGANLYVNIEILILPAACIEKKNQTKIKKKCLNETIHMIPRYAVDEVVVADTCSVFLKIENHNFVLLLLMCLQLIQTTKSVRI